MEASLLKGVGYDLLGGSNHVYLALFICETQRVPSTGPVHKAWLRSGEEKLLFVSARKPFGHVLC